MDASNLQPAPPPHHAAREVVVKTHTARYAARVGPDLLASLGPMTREALGAGATKAVIVADENVPERFAQASRASLEATGIDTTTAFIHASEHAKSLGSLERLCVSFAAHGLSRHDCVVALGGGVTGDLAGMAGAVFKRGLPVVQCPTTLLAMVDAGLGGKTAVNLTINDESSAAPVLLKNALGVFHHPALVVCDTGTLASLPAREFRAGLAECIKHAAIAGTTLLGEDPTAAAAHARVAQHSWDALRTTIARLARSPHEDPRTLTEFIATNMAIKARFVAYDEFEQASDNTGGRALLNLGHTFAHVLETLPGITARDRDGVAMHEGLLHGEAVGLGLIAAAHAGHALALTPQSVINAITDAVEAAGIPMLVSGVPEIDGLIARMSQDKKNRSGVLRIVVPTPAQEQRAGETRGPSVPPARPGRARIVADPPVSALISGWNAICADGG